jgi:hypothetical protein
MKKSIGVAQHTSFHAGIASALPKRPLRRSEKRMESVQLNETTATAATLLGEDASPVGACGRQTNLKPDVFSDVPNDLHD